MVTITATKIKKQTNKINPFQELVLHMHSQLVYTNERTKIANRQKLEISGTPKKRITIQN